MLLQVFQVHCITFSDVHKTEAYNGFLVRYCVTFLDLKHIASKQYTNSDILFLCKWATIISSSVE